MLIVQELHKLGYIEGKNLVMEYRSANGNPEHLAAAAAELVKLNVDIIYAVSIRPPLPPSGRPGQFRSSSEVRMARLRLGWCPACAGRGLT